MAWRSGRPSLRSLGRTASSRTGSQLGLWSMNCAGRAVALLSVTWLLLLGGFYVKFHAGLEEHAGVALLSHAKVHGDLRSAHSVRNNQVVGNDLSARKLTEEKRELELQAIHDPRALMPKRGARSEKTAKADRKMKKRKKKKPQFKEMLPEEEAFMLKQVGLLELKEEKATNNFKVVGKKGFGDGVKEYRVREVHKDMLQAAPPIRQDVVDERLLEDPDLPNLPLPEFWLPKVGQDIDSIGTRIGNKESIYVAISSYRDSLCMGTIANLFNRAQYPERIYVGIVEQNKAGDPTCLPAACEDRAATEEEWLEADLSSDAEEVCRRRHQIRIFHLKAEDSLGPTYARHIGHRLYRGEYFVLQIDAHITFVNNWDAQLVKQWKMTGNERAVLSAYPEDTRGSVDKNGDPVRETSSAMCAFFFEFSSEVGLLQHKAAARIYPKKIQSQEDFSNVSPMLHAFWAAGMSFARGHFVVRVPYDPHTPMLFQGEEILVAVKAWTHGYDFYALARSVLFHPYSRKNKPAMFWENENRHVGTRPRSARRVRTVMGCDDPPDPGANLYELDAYNIGYERPLEWFHLLFGIDCKQNKPTRDICPDVLSGGMHLKFGNYMDPRRQGIDYARLPAIIEYQRQIMLKEMLQEPLHGLQRNLNADAKLHAPGDPTLILDDHLVEVSGRMDLDPDLPALLLPEFWQDAPTEADELDELSSHVNGEPTIYISIASYRDGLCFDTILGAFERARYPDRIIIGAVQQNAPGDPTCLPAACQNRLAPGEHAEEPPSEDVDAAGPGECKASAVVTDQCKEYCCKGHAADQIKKCSVDGCGGCGQCSAYQRNREKMVCDRRNQIRLFHINAEDSVGPTFARHVGSRMYRGEHYALQIDAHVTFVNNWDELIIAQWSVLENEKAVLSTYLKDTTGATNKAGDSVVTTSPIMCDFMFSRDIDYPIVQFKVAYDIDVSKVVDALPNLPRAHDMIGATTTPLLHALWAAGMSFSRGHFVVRVPYDAHYSMMFQGEEALMTLRGWTHGYDSYTPSASVMFHPYNREFSQPKGLFWENGDKRKGAARRSAARWGKILKCNKGSGHETNVRDADDYGLGTTRPVEWYYHLFGMDCEHKERAKDICPDTWAGTIHTKYNAYLREDRLGIDYSVVPEIVEFDHDRLQALLQM